MGSLNLKFSLEEKRIEALVEKQGRPVTFGGNLSSLSIKKGWTEKDLESYQELHGETNITAIDFGFEMDLL